MSTPMIGDHFEGLFEYAPVSLWEQDYSGIKDFLDVLRLSGVSDLGQYLDEEPDALQKSMSLIRVKRVNRETLAMLGATSQAELLANLDSIFRDEMHTHWRAELLALWHGEKSWSGDGINYRLDGEALHVRLNWRILPECEATWECVLVSIENITALKQAEKRFHDLFMHAPISLWEEDYTDLKKGLDALRAQGVVDLRSHLTRNPELVNHFMSLIRVLDVNQKTLDLFEAQDKATLLAKVNKVFRDEMSSHFANELVEMWNGKTHYEHEGVNYSLTGERVNVHLHWTLMPGHEHDFSWVLVALQDITARTKAEEYLRYLGTHDVMTGLYNRAFFDETLQRLEAERRDPVSVIIIDLNNLKVTNDRFGHQVGDQLIRRTGEVLKASLEDGYIAARIGGDEFILIMPDTNAQTAQLLMERLASLAAMNNKFYRDPELSFSLGSATSEPGLPLERMISLADHAMYRHKGQYYRRRREDQ